MARIFSAFVILPAWLCGADMGHEHSHVHEHVVEEEMLTILGSGSSLLKTAVDAWTERFGSARGVTLLYDATGSGTGLQRVLRNESHWAVSEVLPTEQMRAEMPGLRALPLAAAPVAIVANLGNITDGVGLVLDGTILAKIFSFDTLYWDDFAIRERNPGLSLPHARIRPVVRVGLSGMSTVLSRALADFGWLQNAGCQQEGAGCTVTGLMGDVFPGERDAAGAAVHKYDAVGSTSDELARHVQHSPFSIGYVGVGTARTRQLDFVAIVNRAGEITLPNIEHTGQGAAGLVHDGDYARSTGVGYPLVGITYVVSNRDVQTSRQFEGIEPEYLGVTKDQKEAADKREMGEPYELAGENWGFAPNATLHLPGKTCKEYNLLVEFLHWLLTSEEADGLSVASGLAQVAPFAQARTLRALMESECDGARSWFERGMPGTVTVSVPQGSTSLEDTINGIALHHYKEVLSMHTGHVHEEPRLTLATQTAPGVGVYIQGHMSSMPQPPDDWQAIPILVSPLVLVWGSAFSGLPLHLSLSTIKKMLTGEIQTWRHPEVLEGNVFAPLPSCNLVFVADSPLLHAFAESVGVEIGDVNWPTRNISEAAAARYVKEHIGVLSVLSLDTVELWSLSQVHPSLEENGNPVPPSLLITSEGLLNAEISEDLRNMSIPGSQHLYPFIMTVRLFVQRRITVPAELEEAAKGAVEVARGMSVGHDLDHVSTSIQATDVPVIREAVHAFFHSVTVNGKLVYPDDHRRGSEMYLIPVLVAVAVFLCAAPLAFWKYVVDKGKIEQLVSTNQLAEKTAEAIAGMRLEEMEYLREIRNPDRTQLAFIRIIDVLREYKRYLPDAFMQEENCSDDDTDVEGKVAHTPGEFMEVQSTAASPQLNHNPLQRQGSGQ